MSIVSLVQHSGSYSEVYPSISRAIELAGGLPLRAGDRVALKINMCDARPADTGAITSPEFLDGLLHFLRARYDSLEVYVVESDATAVLADEFVKWFGYQAIIERWQATWWNLSTDQIVAKKIVGNYLKEVPVPGLLARAKLITVAKLKTNALSKITGALKNQFGCLPMIQKSVFHDHLPEVIVDANLAMKPIFSIVDSILAMGGPTGPAFGVPIRVGAIVASHDPVGVDSVCATMMGLRPRSVGHIRLAERCGLGSTQPTLVGDAMPVVDFESDFIMDLQYSLARRVKRFQRTGLRLAWRRG